MNVARLQLNAHDGFIQVRETWVPGMDDQAGTIDLNVFSVHLKRFAVGAYADADHLPPGRTSALYLYSVMRYKPFAPHPERHLGGVGQGLKDTVRGSGDEDLGQDRVVVGSDFGRCHSVPHFPGLSGFDVSLEPVHRSIPPGVVALCLLWVSGKSRVSHSHQSTGAYSM